MPRNALRHWSSAFVGLAIGGGLALAVTAGIASRKEEPRAERGPKDSTRARDRATRLAPIDAQRAYDYLKKVVALGPRPSGSEAMQAQQRLLANHFRGLGAKVSFQPFRARHPRTGGAVTMANLFVQWHPETKRRVLLAAHYDTRPFPDRDPRNPRGRFVGANDGGSGVAVLMELAHHVRETPCRYGVDFVLFDAEEFVWSDRDPYFLGSEFFARSYAGNPPSFRYRWGVLLDMVGDADLQVYQEIHSVRWPDTRPLVEQIWGIAADLGIREFVPRAKYEVRDDHLALHDVAGIPTCDVIDFDYPWWHTEGDTPERCSADSLGKVARVVLEWLRRVE